MNDNFISIIRIYGITQNPETKNYAMVLYYANNGSLRNYLDIKYNTLNWDKMIYFLNYIAYGLRHIHKNEIIHRDLHIGNILVGEDGVNITDMGLCKPADYSASENMENKVYGVYLI
jgi:serine/threonine protein kinase